MPNEIVTIDMVKHNLFNDEAKRKEQGETSFREFVVEKQEQVKVETLMVLEEDLNPR